MRAPASGRTWIDVDVRDRAAQPLVSVVIPTYNRVGRLQRVLEALGAQTYPMDRLEVVVVSDGSTDGTDELLASISTPFRLVTAAQANAGPAAARNHGVELAHGELVLFVDDDVVAGPVLVAEHVASHDPEGRTVVIGPMLIPPDVALSPWVLWEQRMLYKQYDAMDRGDYEATSRQFYTGNASLPRRRIVELGGFDTRFRRAEDVELSFRLDQAGMRFAWNRDATAYHYAERSFESWLRTAQDYGRNEVVFGRDHGQDPTLRRVHREFTERNSMIRWVSRASVRVPALGAALVPSLRVAALGASRLGLHDAGQLALSAAYNVAYYRAMADELGGAGPFHDRIVRGDRSITPAPA